MYCIIVIIAHVSKSRNGTILSEPEKLEDDKYRAVVDARRDENLICGRVTGVGHRDGQALQRVRGAARGCSGPPRPAYRAGL